MDAKELKAKYPPQPISYYRLKKEYEGVPAGTIVTFLGSMSLTSAPKWAFMVVNSHTVVDLPNIETCGPDFIGNHFEKTSA